MLWGCGVTVAGYTLGESIPDIDRWLLPIIGVIVIVSFIPVFLEVFKAYRNRKPNEVVLAEQAEAEQ